MSRPLKKQTLPLIFTLLAISACGRDNHPNNTVTPVSYSDASVSSVSTPTASSDHLRYQGSSYNIEYPQSFTTLPSMKSSGANGYDSSFFKSPDGRVFFYICSAQWIADCSDIKINKSTEVLASERRPKTMGKLTRLYTIRAKDNSYLRSYQEVKSVSGYTRWVVGLKYQDEEALEQYRPEYLRFKESFRPFAK